MIRRAAVVVGVVLAAVGFVLVGPTLVIVSGDSMLPAFRSGDFVVAVKSHSYRPGDVVVFRVPETRALVIHRIVGGSAAEGYALQGDNREFRDPWRPTAAEIAGTPLVTVPRLGLLFVLLRTPIGLAVVAGLLTVLLLPVPDARRPRPTVLPRAAA